MPDQATPQDFLIRRDDLHRCEFVPAPVPELQDGQVLLQISQFAFTANNVTYAAFGEAMSYWNFFPAPEGWGRIPVWGFAEVSASRHAEVAVGQRFYGYYPMSSFVVLQPQRVTPAGFADGAPHRQALHPLYNQYLNTAADPGYQAEQEAQIALIRPLYITSFMIDDFLADNAFFGAEAVILSSASSKTAYGLAFLLAQRSAPRCKVIGLTSSANLDFTRGLGCYDQVLTYEQIKDLPADMAVVYVDMAGNGNVRSVLHRHFGEQMKYSCAVGGTHWDQRVADQLAGERLPGARPTLFFAPAQIKKRQTDWGPGGVQQRFALAWQQLMPSLSRWMTVRHGQGPEAVREVYLDMLEGRARPESGNMLSLAVSAAD